MKCPFSLQFCNKLECLLGKKDIWQYESVEVGLKIWFSWEYLNNYREITFLISWNLWNSRNAVSFENCPSHSAHVSTDMFSLNKHLKQESKIKINIHSPKHISSFKHKNISLFKGTMHYYYTKGVLRFVILLHIPNNMKSFHWIRVAYLSSLGARDPSQGLNSSIQTQLWPAYDDWLLIRRDLLEIIFHIYILYNVQ